MNNLYIIFLSALISLTSNAQVVDKVVAVVNNEPILESDMRILEEKLNKPNILDETLLIDFSIENLKKSKDLKISYIVSEKIIDSEIKRLGLQVTQERVEKELKDLAKRNNVSSEELIQVLKQQGFEVSEYREFLKARIERQSLMQSEILSKLRVSDDDAYSEYLAANPTSVLTVNEFSLSHIYFNPQKKTALSASERADGVLEKIRAGGNFESLAEQYSEDPNFSSGGFLGTFKTGEFLPEVEKEIINLGNNQVSNVIKSKLGLHIVKVTNKKTALDPKFEKEKEILKAKIIEKNFKRQLKLWLENKKDEAYIRYNEKK